MYSSTDYRVLKPMVMQDRDQDTTWHVADRRPKIKGKGDTGRPSWDAHAWTHAASRTRLAR